MLSYPLYIDDCFNTHHHVNLTDAGYKKLEARNSDLQPGDDYVVKESGVDGMGREWMPYPDAASTQTFRHTWIMRRRLRPKVPSFAGAPLPRHSSDQQDR